MKKLIYFYLLTVNLQNVVERMIFGNVTGGIHPGIFIKGFVLLILILYYFKQLFTGKVPKNLFTWSLLFFFIIYFSQIIIVEFAQFNFAFVGKSFAFTLKIFLYLLIAYYVLLNSDYFIKKFNSIMLFNIVVVLTNIIAGHYFHLGWQSYKSVADSYRGFLGGNDTSIFSFVSFGYGLYLYKNKKLLSIGILLSSLFAMYIIASKTVFVAGIIWFIYLIYNKNIKKRNLYGLILIFLFIGGYLYFNNLNIINRIFLNYNSSLSRSEKVLNTLSYGNSIFLDIANKIAPERILIAVAMLIHLFTDNLLNILLGYGVGGIYKEFGRPPMMDFFLIIGVYGVMGFLVIYIPLLAALTKLFKYRDFDVVGTLFFSILLYGSIGGFLFGVANTSSIFALLFGIMMSRYYKIYPKNLST